MHNTIPILLTLIMFNCVGAQGNKVLQIKNADTDRGIKNVNVFIPRLDTTLLTDASGLVEWTDYLPADTLIIKKFGFKPQVVSNNPSEIVLQRDTEAFSHRLKLLNLKHTEEHTLIQLSINGEPYWFKQFIAPLFLENGYEFEPGEDAASSAANFKIIKTVVAEVGYCLYGIHEDNPAGLVYATYYDPKVRVKQADPDTEKEFITEKEFVKSSKRWKTQTGCLD